MVWSQTVQLRHQVLGLGAETTLIATMELNSTIRGPRPQRSSPSTICCPPTALPSFLLSTSCAGCEGRVGAEIA